MGLIFLLLVIIIIIILVFNFFNGFKNLKLKNILIKGIANTAYFIATDILSQSVTFPIANIGPAVVAFALGLIYREIKGLKNLLTLLIGLLFAITGIICCGLSY
jgi:hypothetical protein